MASDAKAQKARRDQRRAAGLCPTCGAAPERGITCDACIEKASARFAPIAAAYMKKRRAKLKKAKKKR
jgi:hypothetical protein